MGGKLHLKLKICLRPIATYCEGETQKDFEKRVKVPEIDRREVSWTSFAW